MILFRNKAFMYLLAAAFFRFMGGYSLGYWGKSYFSAKYPEHADDFSVAYFFILAFGSVPSELIGGYIGDAWEEKYAKIKGHLSATGAALGSIFIWFTFIQPSSFWVQIVMYYFEYLTAECFFGHSYA